MEDITTRARSMSSLIGDIEKERYNFDLPIQRRAGIWNRKELSLFIDSVLRNYPIYPALLNRHSDSKILDVVDFKQRFTGLVEFSNNRFALSNTLKPIIIDGVEYEIAGKKYKQLDEAVQERFNNREITVITMADATDEEIRDIFDRINMGHPLTNGHKRSTIETDEVRNIIYSLAAHPFFEKVLSKAQYKKNVDRDIIIQVLMLTEMSDEYDFCSFRNEDMNKFIGYYNDLIFDDNTSKQALDKVELIRDGLDVLDNEFTEKVKIKPTSLPMICYGIYRILNDNKSVDHYIAWVHEFLDNYDSNTAYLAFCGAGTASGEMVKGRLDYFMDAIGEMPMASVDENEKQSEPVVQEDSDQSVQEEETDQAQKEVNEKETDSAAEPKQGRKKRGRKSKTR